MSNKGQSHWTALKIDMSKAYDRMNWNYLYAVQKTMGFSEAWCDLIHNCLSTVSYSMILKSFILLMACVEGILFLHTCSFWVWKAYPVC